MRLAFYITYNLFFVAMLWLGAGEHIMWAFVTAMSIAWVTIIGSLGAIHPVAIESLRKRGSVVPLWIDQVFDVGVILYLIWVGWYVTSLGYFAHMVMIIIAYERAFPKETA